MIQNNDRNGLCSNRDAGRMNLVLEDAEDASDNENIEKIGTMIVRGDNVIIVSPSPR